MATTPAPLSAGKSLRANRFKALKEELKTKSELQGLRSKIEQLQDHEESLNDKITADAWRTADALLAFAKHDCLELCNNVYKAFPREVRDIIYGYIIGCGEVDICSKNHHTRHRCGYRSSNSETQNRLCSSGTHTTTFDLGYDLSLIAALESWDGGLGIIPADYPLDISFLIKFDLLDLQCKHDPWFVYDTPLWPKVFLTKLEGLCSFKPGTKLTIRIQRHNVSLPITQKIKELECNAVVSIILPTLRRLAAIGTETRLCLGGGYELKVDNDKVTLEDMEDEWKKARSH